jgi:hypothetical protein
MPQAEEEARRLRVDGGRNLARAGGKEQRQQDRYRGG